MLFLPCRWDDNGIDYEQVVVVRKPSAAGTTVVTNTQGISTDVSD
jgi:hypothetical protein